MKFTFKRKYTLSFFVFLVLIGLSLTFYFMGPKFINKSDEFFNQTLWVSLADSLLIMLIIIGSNRVNYYLYHDKMIIKKSLRRTVTLEYSQIKDIIEYPNDTIIFMFGTRPSFKLKYQKSNKIKNYRVRVSNHELLKLVLENEKKIHITKNK